MAHKKRLTLDKVDQHIDEFRAALEAGMHLEWRVIYGKRMLVKVYPPAHGVGIGPKVAEGRAAFGRTTRPMRGKRTGRMS